MGGLSYESSFTVDDMVNGNGFGAGDGTGNGWMKIPKVLILDFADWSLSKDPDGVAWSYDPETKLFIAIA